MCFYYICLCLKQGIKIFDYVVVKSLFFLSTALFQIKNSCLLLILVFICKSGQV